MPRFLIEIPHADDRVGCVRALRAIEQHGSHFITHADWGCGSGTHCGWLIAELDSEAEARRIVPPEFRQEARVVELNRFTREQLAALVASIEKQ
jgi:hypothetical protein